MKTIVEITRLPDGRYLDWTDPISPKILEEGRWVGAKGVAVADIWKGKPLSVREVEVLKTKGIFPS
ncbi:MAG: hypothetical protein ACYSRQ_05215 [Planctomycetota bacterium]|jgi:hypothetical protein